MSLIAFHCGNVKGEWEKMEALFVPILANRITIHVWKMPKNNHTEWKYPRLPGMAHRNFHAKMASMNYKVYMETTVVSYLTGRPSRDVVVAGHQQVTRDWWNLSKNRFDVAASELVVQEASAGDKEAAQDRLKILDQLLLLEISEEALDLAKHLIEEGAVPPPAADDALHLSIATVNGFDYLITWNCRHLANAIRRAAIEAAIRDKGYEPPIICTPEELLEDESNEG